MIDELKKIRLESEERLKKYEKEWVILNEILDRQDDRLEKQMQKLAELTKLMDENKQRRKVKGRLLSHEFEDLDLEDWK